MSGEIAPIASRSGAEVSCIDGDRQPPEPLPANQKPREALRASIDREFDDLHRGVASIVWSMYRKWGRKDSPEQIRERVQEVFHEALLRAWDKADSYDPRRRPYSWILRFAVYVLQEQERDEWQHHDGRVEIDPLKQEEEGASALSVLDRLHDLRHETADRLRDLQGLVTVEEWALIEAGHIHDTPAREIGSLLGISEGAVRVRLHRAVRSFKAAYQHANTFGR